MTIETIKRSAEFDVIVAGSGAAGMTAALTAALRGLSVVVLEKTGSYGGATAISGGALWIPDNFLMREAGLRDDLTAAASYMTALSGETASVATRNAYLTGGPRMLLEFQQKTKWMRWRMLGYPDYHPEIAGGLNRGRSVEALTVDGHELGPLLSDLRRPSQAMDLGPVTITADDFIHLNMFTRTREGRRTAGRVLARSVSGVLARKRLLSIGQALVARLRLALRDLSVEVLLSAPLDELLVDSGRVSGVRAQINGGPTRLRARRGVVVTTGGFSRNQDMRDRYLPTPSPAEWSMAPEDGQSGDGILAATRAGAATDLMHRTWGMPTVRVPIKGLMETLLTQCERAMPGTLVVDQAGRRYMNESLPYEDSWKVMYERSADVPSVPSWLIFGHNAHRRYLLFGRPPVLPFPRAWLKSAALVKSVDVGALARAVEVDEAVLSATMGRYNAIAADGQDVDYNRGETEFARFFGDPTLSSPCLMPLSAPFYAMKLFPGELSTKGGVRVDEHGRALREDGTVIRGLYAAGNAAGAPGVGDSYPGAGGTIGPAMVFGYLAAHHAAAQG